MDNMNKKELTLKVDPSDLEGMLEVMDKYGDSDTMYFGKNEDGEDVHISVFSDKIRATTYQSNHWVRKNTYYRDGSWDEMFDGKWTE